MLKIILVSLLCLVAGCLTKVSNFKIMNNVLQQWDGTEVGLETVITRNKNVQDAYGHKMQITKYIYLLQGQPIKYMRLFICSAGPDGIFNTKDDQVLYKSSSTEIIGKNG